ncbi:hypothetical protein [Mesorhizobium sp. B2-6-1]|uniref:hypothetical protein n=1 Tax=Mesorhizobium sp. B2-6-1 TaxID=2589916 RepID=UPI001127485F|nr:hypothetical protein [Mesorhizobium sp. B2-6-1]TPJ62250.1 hypothetical protein FJ443_14420 [Mesorhizobium sp. B2-6-1]
MKNMICWRLKAAMAIEFDKDGHIMGQAVASDRQGSELGQQRPDDRQSRCAGSFMIGIFS